MLVFLRKRPSASWRRDRNLRIEHIGDVDAGGGSVLERDFRKRAEEKLAYASV